MGRTHCPADKGMETYLDCFLFESKFEVGHTAPLIRGWKLSEDLSGYSEPKSRTHCPADKGMETLNIVDPFNLSEESVGHTAPLIRGWKHNPFAKLSASASVSDTLPR